MKIDLLLLPQQLEKEIRSLQVERDTLRAYAEKSTSFISLAPGHGQGVNRMMEDIMTRVADIDSEIKKKQAELVKTRTTLLNQIAKLNDSNTRTVLIMRYIFYIDWSTISETVGYDERHCMRLAEGARRALASM